MAGVTRSNFDEVYESFVEAVHDLYVTTKKSTSGNVVAQDRLVSAIERYDRAYLELRARAIESAGKVDNFRAARS